MVDAADLDWAGLVSRAFSDIGDKNALAWSVLDTKSEQAVVRALALQINRDHPVTARAEFPPRVDLVLLRELVPAAAFEAKAAYLTDYQPARILKHDWYLGGCVDEDIGRLSTLTARLPSLQYRAALFFLYEVGDPRKQLKYGEKARVELNTATAALVSDVPHGRLAAQCAIDCGEAHGTRVKIHQLVFEPRL